MPRTFLAAEGPHVIDRYWLRPVRRRTEELLTDFEPGDPWPGPASAGGHVAERTFEHDAPTLEEDRYRPEADIG
jgi:hypothetical protein